MCEGRYWLGGALTGGRPLCAGCRECDDADETGTRGGTPLEEECGMTGRAAFG